jgi:hypothetical protein
MDDFHHGFRGPSGPGDSRTGPASTSPGRGLRKGARRRLRRPGASSRPVRGRRCRPHRRGTAPSRPVGRDPGCPDCRNRQRAQGDPRDSQYPPLRRLWPRARRSLVGVEGKLRLQHTEEAMAITRLKVSNFKSFAELDVELRPLNIVVGSNAAGKSNFLEIFRFIRDVAVEGTENAVSLQGGTCWASGMACPALPPGALRREESGRQERLIPVFPAKAPIGRLGPPH